MATLIAQEILEQKRYTICEKCPCLRHDGEMGYPDCGCGYDVVDIQIRGDKYNSIEVSENCGLVNVTHENNSFKPERRYISPVKDIYEYNELDKTMYASNIVWLRELREKEKKGISFFQRLAELGEKSISTGEKITMRMSGDVKEEK